LLVAIAITSMMIALIARIFFDTSAAVSRGVQISHIIDSSRVLSDQIERDAQEMLGPNQGGYLIVVGKSYANITVPGKTAGGVVVPHPNSNVTTTRSIRSDQLLFIRTSSTLESQCPKTISTFSAANADLVQPSAASAYARVWYGHLLRTKADGSSDSGARLGDAKNDGLNTIGTGWILGRQAMMMANDQDLSALGIASIYSNDGNGHSDPQGYAYGQSGGELDTSNSVFGYASSRKVYEGVTDITKGGLPTLKDNKKENGSNGSNGNGNGGRWGANRKAKKWIVEALSSTFVAERLRVNPAPNVSMLTASNSEQIAQMHPHLMSNVSDFIVEFAGDYSPKDNSIDTDVSGNITWYGLGATDVLYDSNTNNEPDPFYENSFSTAEAVNADKAYFFRNGKSSRVSSTVATTTNWPHLIRIRYRLHDARGRYAESTDGASGKWFEQIIKVNREN